MLSHTQQSDIHEPAGQVKKIYPKTHKGKTSVNLSAFRHHAIKTYVTVETRFHTLVTSEVAANISNLHTPLGDYT